MVTPNPFMAFIKPQRSEAAARLRTNGFAAIALFIATNLLPVPSLWSALRVAWFSPSASRDVGTLWYGVCVTELCAFALLSVNILQAVYALQYPLQTPPPPTPSKPRSVLSTPPSQRKLSGISTISPKMQKSFSSSTSVSALYASSPLSTPSRTLHYSTPLDLSLASSTGSPSPIFNSPLAAYRGRHRSSAGRALDGDLYARLMRKGENEDE